MSGTEKTVLTVENDQHVRKLLVDVVLFAGYRPLEAATSREALEIIHREQVDLILLDLNLPDINGQQLLRFIRKGGNTTPVIVISGFITKEVLQDILATGVSSAMTKPVDANRLLATMRNVLRSS